MGSIIRAGTLFRKRIVPHVVLARIRRRFASPNTIMWSMHFRRIESMSLST
jgi:hypothetical protein